MNKFWGHLKTITHHRHLVMRGCFRMGLIWQGPVSYTHLDVYKRQPLPPLLRQTCGSAQR